MNKLRPFSLIAAMARNRGIGYRNMLPWKKFPQDMKFFKQTTSNNNSNNSNNSNNNSNNSNNNSNNNTIIMGRKTWKSLNNPNGLPKRENIILSRNSFDQEFMDNNLRVCHDLDHALKSANSDSDIFVIGGSCIYTEAISHPSCQRILMTHIDQDLIVDTYFPAISQQDYRINKILQSGKNIPIVTLQNETIKSNYEIVEYIRRPAQETNTFVSSYREETGYLRALKDILTHGETRQDRTGTGTKSLFGLQMRFDLQNNQFPLLTTKKMFTKGIISELLWFLSGSTDTHILRDQGVHIWDGNTSREFLDQNNFTDRPEGDMGPSYSFQFRHAGAQYQDKFTDYTQDPNRVDQVKQLVHDIKTNPHSRRHIINLWNVPDIKNMSLPPCLFLYQFYVSQNPNSDEPNYLNCSLYQRSADMGLGVPFNIASASLLTNIVAQLTDLQPGELIHNIGDAHIYTDHITRLHQQITRLPRPFPILEIRQRNQQQVEDFQPTDFKINGYYPYPSLKMKMAV